MRTQGVDSSFLVSDQLISVEDTEVSLNFRPTNSARESALVFLCGAGVAPEAYAPLLRPLATDGFSVFIVRLPYRFAPLESHKQTAVDRVDRILSEHPEFPRWVVAGHSLGGALTCRIVLSRIPEVAAAVLVGTTHPKRDDLSRIEIPITKVYASNDGVAPVEKVLANQKLLPDRTKYVEVQGGNHSQFGHYGHQLMDGTATISREDQQATTRRALRETLEDASKQLRQ